MSDRWRVLRPGAVVRRAAIALAAPLLLVPVGTRCFSDLVHPAAPRVDYVFTAPLTDTMINIGDATEPMSCHLTANGREIGCQLDLAVAGTAGVLVAHEERIWGVSLGTATVEMRPLNVAFPLDTIVRRARVRAVVPRVVWADNAVIDTLGPGVMKLLLALPETRTGAIVTGAPLEWVQDSGVGVAHLISYLPGWIVADSVGVAVFRVLSDTASSLPRRVVVVKGPVPSAGAAPAGERASGRGRP